MANVTIYTKPYCPYCVRAISLLEQKGVAFTEIEAAFDPEKRQEMMRRSGRATFPQIFVGDQHIGGCDDMMALERGPSCCCSRLRAAKRHEIGLIQTPTPPPTPPLVALSTDGTRRHPAGRWA